MAQLLIRKLDARTMARLRRRAQRNRRSLQAEAREILRQTLAIPEAPVAGLGTRIAALFASVGGAPPIKELRGYPARPASFEP